MKYIAGHYHMGLALTWAKLEPTPNKYSFSLLSDRKLAALTATHIFFIKRPDGTTAAERFFDTKPRAMFEFLLEKVDLPGRPAQRRRAPKQIESLQAMV